MDGDLTDSSVTGLDGTYSGTRSGGVKFGTGQIGNDVYLYTSEGSEQIQIADDAVWDTGDYVSVSSWFITSVNNSGAAMVVHDHSNYKYLTYLTDATGDVALYIRTASGVSVATHNQAAGALKGSWHHVLGVYDRTLGSQRLKLYLDGVLVKTADGYDEPISAGDEGITIGDWISGSSIYALKDDVGIWDNALSAGEAISIYHLGTNTVLNYDLGKAQQLFEEFDSPSGGVEIDSRTWVKRAGWPTDSAGTVTNVNGYYRVYLTQTEGMTDNTTGGTVIRIR